MAESVTLANVFLDTTGVVQGVEEGNRALNDGQASMEEYSATAKASTGTVSTFVSKLFDLKGALITVGSALGITAVLAAVAIGLKNLLSAVLENSEAWQVFKERVSDTFRALVLGETNLDRISRKLEGIVSGAGLSGLLPKEDIQKLAAARSDAISLLSDLFDERRFTKLFPNIPQLGLLFNKPPRNLAAIEGEITLVKNAIKGLNEKLREQVKLFVEIGGKQFQFAALFDVADAPFFRPEPPEPPEPLDPFVFAGIPKPEDLEKAVGEATGVLGFLRKEFNENRLSADALATATENITAKLLALGATESDLAKLGIALTEAFKPERVEAFEAAMTQLAETLDAQRVAAETVQLLIQGATNAIVAALKEGGVASRKAIAQMLEDLGRLFINYAVAWTALGIIATTPWGRFLGSPAQFFKGAALAFAVGAAAIAASKAVGGGGEEGGGGQAKAAFGPSAPIGQRTAASVTVIIQGSAIGVGDENTLARDIADLISTAQKDGVR